jgi:hypothetical protein
MDIDSDLEGDIQGHHNKQLQQLSQQAVETRTRPAEEGNKDVASNHTDSDESEDASGKKKVKGQGVTTITLAISPCTRSLDTFAVSPGQTLNLLMLANHSTVTQSHLHK